MSVIIFGIGLAIAVILIADSVFLFQKLSHGQIMESLMKDDEEADSQEDKESSH